MKSSNYLPRIFVNSVPDGAINWILSILSGVPNFTHRSEDGFYNPNPALISDQRSKLGALEPGAVAIGHIYHSAEWESMLHDLEFKSIFLYRDPRDVIVLLTDYYTNVLTNAPVYAHLYRCLHNKRDRIRALITGFFHDSGQVPNITAWYRPFLPWRADSSTLCINVEVLAQSEETRIECIRSIADYLGTWGEDNSLKEDVVRVMLEKCKLVAKELSVQRDVRPWREEFDEATKSMFKAVAGDLLIELGYELDCNW